MKKTKIIGLIMIVGLCALGFVSTVTAGSGGGSLFDLKALSSIFSPSHEEEVIPGGGNELTQGGLESPQSEEETCSPEKRCGDIFGCAYCGSSEGLVALGLLRAEKVNGQTVYYETTERVPQNIPGETEEEKAERIMKGYDVNPPDHKEAQQPTRKKIFVNVNYQSTIEPNTSVTVTFNTEFISLKDPGTTLHVQWEGSSTLIEPPAGWRDGRFVITPYSNPGIHRLYLNISNDEGWWDITTLKFTVLDPAEPTEPEGNDPEEEKPEETGEN